MSFTIRTVVSADLTKLGAEVAAKVGVAVQKGAHAVQAQAMTTVPVDTGNLKNSHATTSEGPLSAKVSASTPYAIYVHEGTYKMAGRPWLRQALEGQAPRIVADIQASVA